MLYRLVKAIVRMTLMSYFRKITTVGAEYIPTRGPVIFVANHPSAFMDPMVIAALIKRPLHFIAGGEFFGSGLKSWLYREQFNMIPVYRPNTMPGEVEKNQETFARCYDILSEGGAVLIFPEGSSVTEKRLRKLKTGVARIALGTREHTGNIEVSIVPIGLNYANPHRFRSDLLIKIGKVVIPGELANDKQGAEELTARVEQSLQETVLHNEDASLDSLMKKVDLVLKYQSTDTNHLQQFESTRKMIHVFREIREVNPTALQRIERKLNSYLLRIRDIQISDRSVALPSIQISAVEMVRLLVGLPVFLVGASLNMIPYYATVYTFRAMNLFEREGARQPGKKVNPAFFGSVAMALGMVMFIVSYAMMTTALTISTKVFWIGIPALATFYTSGLFALRYGEWFRIVTEKIKLSRLVHSQKASYHSLVSDRKRIINILNSVSLQFTTK